MKFLYLLLFLILSNTDFYAQENHNLENENAIYLSAGYGGGLNLVKNNYKNFLQLDTLFSNSIGANLFYRINIGEKFSYQFDIDFQSFQKDSSKIEIIESHNEWGFIYYDTISESVSINSFNYSFSIKANHHLHFESLKKLVPYIGGGIEIFNSRLSYQFEDYKYDEDLFPIKPTKFGDSSFSSVKIKQNEDTFIVKLRSFNIGVNIGLMYQLDMFYIFAEYRYRTPISSVSLTPKTSTMTIGFYTDF